jgi:hypothetical protein
MARRPSTWERLCFILEDAHQAVKISGRTRIPAGVYALDLRMEGGMHSRYWSNLGSFHKGMIWLRNVPGFEWVYLHIGNDEDDTEGCLLTGDGTDEVARTVQQSTNAYKRIYPEIARATIRGSARITIRDLDILTLPLPPLC